MLLQVYTPIIHTANGAATIHVWESSYPVSTLDPALPRGIGVNQKHEAMHGKERAWMRKVVHQDNIGEYAATDNDELMRCDVQKGHGGAGVGWLEYGVEQDGHTEVVQDRFGLESGSGVAGPD